MQVDGWTAVDVINPTGASPVLLVCEHASNTIPADLDGLGLTGEAAISHAAWDIGARDVATALAHALDAPLVTGTLSRLVYDLNRPPEAPDAIPGRSEIFDVPGNRGLDAASRAARVSRVHDPFHATLARTVSGRAALVTVHSFTPVYAGRPRAVELGFLHHREGGFAEAALSAERAHGTYRAALNEPYSVSDGVTYTLERHGEGRGLPALMIEIRNDLIATGTGARAMADHLAETLRTALAALPGAGRAAG